MRVWVKRGILAALADFAFSPITGFHTSRHARRGKRERLVIWEKTFLTVFAENLESVGRVLLHEFRKPSGTTQRPAPGSASCPHGTGLNSCPIGTILFWAAEMDARLQPQLLFAEQTLGSRFDARFAPRRFTRILPSRRARADFSRVRRLSSAINLGLLQLR
jgi:hypothetical protein